MDILRACNVGSGKAAGQKTMGTDGIDGGRSSGLLCHRNCVVYDRICTKYRLDRTWGCFALVRCTVRHSGYDKTGTCSVVQPAIREGHKGNVMEEVISVDYQYKLRAHHGMCIAFFHGKGYNSKFISHMSEMIHELDNNPNICITMQTDAICLKCPNNIQGICQGESKVAEYDRQVLRRCGLRDGMIMMYEDFRKSVYENILLPGRRELICGTCQWNEICHKDI